MLARKEAVDFGIWHQVRESSEAAIGRQRLYGAHEAGPRRQCQRTADADASHAERLEPVDPGGQLPAAASANRGISGSDDEEVALECAVDNRSRRPNRTR